MKPAMLAMSVPMAVPSSAVTTSVLGLDCVARVIHRLLFSRLANIASTARKRAAMNRARMDLGDEGRLRSALLIQ
jgi:hypothetical protein